MLEKIPNCLSLVRNATVFALLLIMIMSMTTRSFVITVSEFCLMKVCDSLCHWKKARPLEVAQKNRLSFGMNSVEIILVCLCEWLLLFNGSCLTL